MAGLLTEWLRIEPAVLLGQRAQVRHLMPAHAMTSRDLSLGGAPTHLRKGDSVLKHLDSPSLIAASVGTSSRRPLQHAPHQIEVSFNSSGSKMPKTQWLHYGGNPLAPIRRKTKWLLCAER